MTDSRKSVRPSGRPSRYNAAYDSDDDAADTTCLHRTYLIFIMVLLMFRLLEQYFGLCLSKCRNVQDEDNNQNRKLTDAEKEKLKKQREKLRAEIEDLMKTKTELDTAKNSATDEVGMLKRKVDDLEWEVKNLREDSGRQVEELKDMNWERNECKRKLQIAEDEVASLKYNNERQARCQDELHEAKRKYRDYKHQNKDLEKRLQQWESWNNRMPNY